MLRRVQLIIATLIVSLSLTGCMKIRSMSASISSLVKNCNEVDQDGDGTESNPYIVCSWSQLAALENGASGTYYQLGTDLDLTGVTVSPITGFEGILDGAHHTISHFSYRSTGGYAGLFDALNGATIKNLTLDQFKVNGQQRVAALVGAASDSQFSGIKIKNSVISSVNGFAGVFSAAFDNSTATDVVISDSLIFGGFKLGLFSGQITNNSMISESAVHGSIVAAAKAGGIAGVVADSIFDRVAVNAKVNIPQNGYYASNVDDQKEAGLGFGNIQNSYIQDSLFTGKVTVGADYAESIGGLAGLMQTTDVNTSLIAATTLMDVQGNASGTDGVVGSDSGNAYTDVYFFTHAKVFTNSTSAMDVNESDLADFSTFSGFDSSLWQMTTGTVSFPILKFAQSTAVFDGRDLDLEPSGPMYVTEIEGTNGLTFDDVNSNVWDTTEHLDGFGAVIESKLTFTNASAYPINLTEIETTGVRGAFDLATGGYTGSCAWIVGQTPKLGVGQSCTVGIRFYPYNAESSSDLMQDGVVIHYTYTNSDNEKITDSFLHTLEGTGVLQGPHIADGAQNYTDTPVGNTASIVLDINNDGPGDAEIVSFTTTGDSEFAIDSGVSTTCSVGGPLVSSDTCQIKLNFSPSSASTFSGNLSVVYEDVVTHLQRTATITLDGRGFVNPFHCGLGTFADPWCVGDRAELELVKTYTSSYFIQTANIDLVGCGADVFTPISSFSGSYDGDGYKIQNLCSTEAAGFVVSNSGILKNIIFENIQVDNSTVQRSAFDIPNGVGGIVLWNSGGTIQYLTVSGSVSMPINTGGSTTGGVVARMSSGTFENITANITVSGIERTGGLVGYLSGAAVFIAEFSGSVTASSSYTGGLVGAAVGAGANTMLASSSASVTSAGIQVGGLVGLLWDAIITQSFSTGDVTGAGRVGGVTGEAAGSSQVTQSFASGDVISATGSEVGGVIGRAWAGAYTVSNCLAVGSISGSSSVGGLIGTASGGGMIMNSLSLSSSVTGGGSVTAFVGSDSGAQTYMNNHYYNYPGATADVNATGIDNSMGQPLTDSAQYTGFNFPGNWRMLSSTPSGFPAAAAVPSWTCGLVSTGFNCI